MPSEFSGSHAGTLLQDIAGIISPYDQDVIVHVTVDRQGVKLCQRYPYRGQKAHCDLLLL